MAMDVFRAVTIDPAEMGWLGDARQIWVPGMSDRFSAAVAQRAAELGIEVTGLDTNGPYLTIEAGTPEAWLAADKLCAYIEGLRDALTDSYGNTPVTVGRKDLQQVLGALAGTWNMDPGVTAAARRLRQVLDGQPVSAP